MPNPFDSLKPKEVEYDEWGGAFSCQERDCYEVINRARYIKKERILTWKPACGHISVMENVDE